MRHLKNLIYYILLFCRPVIMSLGRFIGGFFSLGGIGGLMIFPKGWPLHITALVLGFLLFVLRQKYDDLVFKFCPPDQNICLDIA